MEKYLNKYQERIFTPTLITVKECVEYLVSYIEKYTPENVVFFLPGEHGSSAQVAKDIFMLTVDQSILRTDKSQVYQKAYQLAIYAQHLRQQQPDFQLIHYEVAEDADDLVAMLNPALKLDDLFLATGDISFVNQYGKYTLSSKSRIRLNNARGKISDLNKEDNHNSYTEWIKPITDGVRQHIPDWLGNIYISSYPNYYMVSYYLTDCPAFDELMILLDNSEIAQLSAETAGLMRQIIDIGIAKAKNYFNELVDFMDVVHYLKEPAIINGLDGENMDFFKNDVAKDGEPLSVAMAKLYHEGRAANILTEAECHHLLLKMLIYMRVAKTKPKNEIQLFSEKIFADLVAAFSLEELIEEKDIVSFVYAFVQQWWEDSSPAE